jgi:hypothetical protein
MAGRLTAQQLGADELRVFLEQSIAGLVAASAQIPINPANLPFHIQIGQNILALEALLRYIP